MSKVTTYKCDRCGVLMEGSAELERGIVRMATPEAIYLADLCRECSEQIRSGVTFTEKSRKKRRQRAAA